MSFAMPDAGESAAAVDAPDCRIGGRPDGPGCGDKLFGEPAGEGLAAPVGLAFEVPLVVWLVPVLLANLAIALILDRICRTVF